MDFHSLSRKDLQTLCKKNKIPANITNVAMADALAALPQVEGLDKILNPTEADAETGTPDIHHHRTACRTSTRRKGIREAAESTNVSTPLHRGTRAKNVEVEQENKDSNVNVPVIPAVVPSSRRRAPAVSTRRKKEAEDDDKNGVQGKPTDVLKTTPAAAPSSRTRAGGTSVQAAYNTRRSVRLLEKNLSMMSLLDAEDMGPAKIDDGISEEMSNVSQQTEDSSETEKVNDAGVSLQTLSTVVSDKTDELEVSSLEKNTEYECQLHDLDSGSEVELASGTENDVGAGVQVESQEEAEPHDSNLKLEGNSETCDDSNDVTECCDESVVDLNKSIATGEAMHADNEAGSELLSELEDSCDSSEPDNKKCLGTKQDALFVEASEDAFMKVDQDIAALPVVVPDGTSMEVTDQDVAGFHPMSSVSDDSVKPKELVECNTGEAVHADNEAGSELLSGLEDSCDSSEPDNKKCLGTKQDALSVEASEDAFMKVTDQDIAALPLVVPDGASMEVTDQDIAALLLVVPDGASMEVTDQDVAGFHPMSSVSDDSVKPKELLEFNTDNQGINEDDDNQDNNETADGNYIQNFEPMYDGEEKAADEKDLASPEWVLELGSSTFCSSGEHQEEELEAKSEHSEESRAEMDNASDVTGASSAILAVEKDARSENSVAVIEVCTESSADESMDAENVTLEASLLDVVLHETEDQKEDSEKLVAKAQAEESEKHAAGEETASDAASAFPCVPDGICSPQIPLFHQQDSVESAGSSIDSCSSDALVSVLSYNSNTLVDGDVVPEEIAIPKQESSVSAETVTDVPIHEQKTSDIPIQLIVADHLKGESLYPAQSETEGVANEIQTVPKMISSTEDNMHNVNMMKENTTDELHNMSIRELKKKLKSLTLDGKSNCMRKTNNVVKEEVEKKRIALQALPENRMTTGEAQNDG